MGVWSDHRGHYECPTCKRVNLKPVQPLTEGTVICSGMTHMWFCTGPSEAEGA